MYTKIYNTTKFKDSCEKKEEDCCKKEPKSEEKCYKKCYFVEETYCEKRTEVCCPKEPRERKEECDYEDKKKKDDDDCFCDIIKELFFKFLCECCEDDKKDSRD